jgi:serine/threonine-protein phosphatase 4 regulatory subunit 1
MGYYLTYNFPAILYCYGKDYWPKLKSIYFDFCFESDIKIRRSIIASFHEICKIIGQTITENELLPVYDIFLGSNNKSERNLAVRNLPKILIQVDKEKKKKYFKYLEAASIFIDNIGSKVRNFNFINWKNKLDVIEGILCYYNLYDDDIIYKSIFPQCITFCLDDIYKVRITSSKVLATLIDYLYNINYKKEQLFLLIDSFWKHKKFQQRVNFVKMCKIFLKNKNLYEEKIKNVILELVEHEKIKDVKIFLSKVLKNIITNDKNILYKDETIHKICFVLKKQNIPIINNIFNDVMINYIEYKEEKNEIKNTEIKKEKYFTGDNEFFIKEFKIELEKKTSIFFLDKNSSNNKKGDINNGNNNNKESEIKNDDDKNKKENGE